MPLRCLLAGLVAAAGLCAVVPASFAAQAVLTGPPTMRVLVGDIVADHYTPSYRHRDSFEVMVTVQITGTAPCTVTDAPVDPASQQLELLYVNGNRMTRELIANPCDPVGGATDIYAVGETWTETQPFYELGEVDVPIRRGALRRTYPIRLTWAGQVVQPLRFVRAFRSGFRKGFRREIFDYDFDPYINICVNGNLPLHARGGHLYCVYERPSTALVKVRVS